MDGTEKTLSRVGKHRDRSRYIEKRRTLAHTPPSSYEELKDFQKALLDLAVCDGSVLLVGRRMGSWIKSAGLLVHQGVLTRREATNFFEPTPFGLALYGARKKK